MTLDNETISETPANAGLGRVAAACVLALGLGIAGYFLGQALETGMGRLRAPHMVTVKGLAERPVKADLALWPLRLVATGNDMAVAGAKVDSDLKAVRDFLKAQGLSEGEVTLGRVDVADLMAREYRNEKAQESRFIVRASVMIRSENVDLVQAISRKMGELVKAGVAFESGDDRPSALPPYYLFTKLNDVKLEMLAEATHNARAAAEQFASDAQVGLANMVSANQGTFSILPGDPTPDAVEETQIQKVVRVVSTVSYALGN